MIIKKPFYIIKKLKQNTVFEYNGEIHMVSLKPVLKNIKTWNIFCSNISYVTTVVDTSLPPFSEMIDITKDVAKKITIID